MTENVESKLTHEWKHAAGTLNALFLPPSTLVTYLDYYMFLASINYNTRPTVKLYIYKKTNNESQLKYQQLRQLSWTTCSYYIVKLNLKVQIKTDSYYLHNKPNLVWLKLQTFNNYLIRTDNVGHLTTWLRSQEPESEAKYSYSTATVFWQNCPHKLS